MSCPKKNLLSVSMCRREGLALLGFSPLSPFLNWCEQLVPKSHLKMALSINSQWDWGCAGGRAMAKVLQMTLSWKETQNSRKRMRKAEVEQASKRFKGGLHQSQMYHGNIVWSFCSKAKRFFSSFFLPPFPATHLLFPQIFREAKWGRGCYEHWGRMEKREFFLNHYLNRKFYGWMVSEKNI